MVLLQLQRSILHFSVRLLIMMALPLHHRYVEAVPKEVGTAIALKAQFRQQQQQQQQPTWNQVWLQKNRRPLLSV
jgi:hypothetical protein